MFKTIIQLLVLISVVSANAQDIKTIQLKPVGSTQQLSIVPLGTTLELSFDDLDNDNKEYQYKIEHQTYDWQASDLMPSQYINGFQQNYITKVSYSFNTLQEYTHYSISFPNANTRITKTGNYLISVLDEDERVLFSRQFTYYQNKTLVGVSVHSSRISKAFNEDQNVQVIVNHKNFKINNPQAEVKVAIIKNNNWKSVQYNELPQYFKLQQLIYTYIDKNNFKGGNEYRHFDNKSIQNTSIDIYQSEMKDLYHNHLYTSIPRRSLPYAYNPDANGQFIIRTLDGEDPNTDADYALVHFILDDMEYSNKSVYIVGQFNNYELSDDYKMTYTNDAYMTVLKLKQGFYDYEYVTLNEDGSIDESSIDGSFYQTDNEYTVLVYYHPIGGLYDEVIGVGRGYVKN